MLCNWDLVSRKDNRKIDMTSIEELFLSIDNAYPQTERGFRKFYQGAKVVGAMPTA